MVYTDEQYLEQGFTVEELPLIREHDTIMLIDLCYQTEEEFARVLELQEILGI